MKVVVAFLFLALVSTFAWFSHSCGGTDQIVAADLRMDVQRGLADHPQQVDVQASINHLDVVLTGKVPPGSKSALADGIAANLRAGRVINRLEEESTVTMPSALLPAKVFFQRKGPEMFLSGLVANQATKLQLAASARELVEVQRVINDIEVSDRASPLGDPLSMPEFSRSFMAAAQEGYFQWSSGQFVIRGSVVSGQARRSIVDSALALLDQENLVNELELLESSSASPLGVECLLRPNPGGGHAGLLRGSVSSADLRARALVAAREAVPQIQWTNELVVAPGPSFPVEFLGPILKSYANDHLNHVDGGFVLTPEEVRFTGEAYSMAARVGLAEAVDGHSQSRLRTAFADIAGSRELILSQRRTSQWLAMLGSLPNETIRMKVLQSAKVPQSGDKFFDFTAVGLQIDSPMWQDELPGFVAGYSDRHGLTDFDLQGDRLTLLGSVASEPLREGVELWASRQFGNRVIIDNRLTVAENREDGAP